MKLTAPSIRKWDPPETRAVYWAGGIAAATDALPDSVVEHRPGGLKSLQNLRHSWIKTNHDLADAYAKRIGLMK